MPSSPIWRDWGVAAMAKGQSAGTNGKSTCLHYLDRDEREWHVFLVDAQVSRNARANGPTILRVVMAEKVLELVRQEIEMTVYVNPEPSGADEWVTRGEVWEIRSSQLESSFGPTTIGGGKADRCRSTIAQSDLYFVAANTVLHIREENRCYTAWINGLVFM